MYNVLYNIYLLLPSVTLLVLIVAYFIKKKRNKAVSETLPNESAEIFEIDGKINLFRIINNEYKKYISEIDIVGKIVTIIGSILYLVLALLISIVILLESDSKVFTLLLILAIVFIIYFLIGSILFVLDYTFTTLQHIEDKSLSDFVTIAFLEIVIAIPIIFLEEAFEVLPLIRIVMFVTYLLNYFLVMIAMIEILKDPAKVAGNISESENKAKSKRIYITTIILVISSIVVNLYILVVGAYWIQHYEAYRGLCEMKYVNWSLFYYTIISFTTVGYGDITPATPLSQFVSIIISITSVLCLVIFVGTAVSYFKEKSES